MIENSSYARCLFLARQVMTFEPFLFLASHYNSPDQEVLVMKACSVRIMQNEGKVFELNCQRDTNNEVIQIFDLLLVAFVRMPSFRRRVFT